MAISSFIKKVCVQTAVYWGNPVEDGSGGMTYDAPVQIKCRWTDKQHILNSAMGEQLVARSSVLVTEDLDLEGWLFLGSLDDLLTESNDFLAPTNPMTVDGAYKIMAIEKTPMIRSTTEFVRTVHLKA